MVCGDWIGGVAVSTTQSRLGTFRLQFFGPLNFAAGVINLLHALDVDFFIEGIVALVAHWNRFLSRGSQYVKSSVHVCVVYG